MKKVFWNFKENGAEKAKIYRRYHLNSEHTVRTQCFNAPKLDYKIEEAPYCENREAVWEVPVLEDIPDNGVTLKQSLMKRRTSWDFQKQSLTEQEIERFIAYSFGINDKTQCLKTYPSGGRLYPVEIYLIPTVNAVGKNEIFNTNHVLQYNVHTRVLYKNKLYDPNRVDTLISATDIGSFSFCSAQFLVCLVGNPVIMEKKYHALTYRLMHDECGHIGQNIMLTAATMDLNVVPLGGFFEDRILSMLGCEKTGKQVLYVLAVG